MTEKITKFREQYFFLSNMYPVPVFHEGIKYVSSENLYQALKSNRLAERSMIARLEPIQSKRWWKSNPVTTRHFFRDRVDYMMIAVAAKFDQNPSLRKLLLKTGDAEILEGNTWRDYFWGVDSETLEGENHLGKILMQLRENYKKWS